MSPASRDALKGHAMPSVTPPMPSPAGVRVTMKDVAAALGVSTATVSRALQDDPAISAATKSAVLEVARRVQYRPSAAARRLRTKSASLVGVVVQSVGDGYIGDVVLGIQGRAREFGYQPLFFAAEGQPGLESEALDVFLSEHVTQLIAVSPTGKPQLLRRAVAEGMRVAVINGDPTVPARHFTEVTAGSTGDKILKMDRARSSPICDIRFDDFAAGKLATEHLIGLGHRSFVHVRGPSVRSGMLRLMGFREALVAAGLWPQPVLSARVPAMHSREDTVTRYLRTVSPPVAMVAYDDLCAVAALRAAHRAGWRVPYDLSVVGIDDIQFASYTNPGLTTVAQPKHQLGALAVDALLGEGGCDARPRVLDGQLVIRESAGPPSSPAGGGQERPR
jgi:DNA-binding LacI/PurR family transcriptional regulator